MFVAEQHVNFSRASYGLSALKLKERISAEPTPRTPARVKASPVSKRIERQEERQHHRPARSVRLQVMNVLGSLFLLMMGIGILNVEMSDYPPTRSEQVANMLGDSGVNDNYGVDARLQSLYNALRTKTHAPIHRILLDGTFPKDEVENIRAEISHSFPGCEIIELENKEYTVCVIAFVNQELAQSYRDLIQKDIQYQLRISAK